MVYGFVKQSRGHVKVYSELGHGTSFRLYFPRADAAAREHGNAASALNGKLPAGRGTILVVEDDLAVRRMAVSALAELGYQVREAQDGRAALEILQGSGPIDLLFTDMIMPNGISGHELAKTARGLRPGLKVLLTSGYSEQFIATRNDRDPSLQLLTKPYRRERLAAAVHEALNGA
jgi:CheY-like chemotaxis protein